MLNIRSNLIPYKTLQASYKRYVKSYAQLNNGSVQGARSFFEFYYYMNYTCKYADPRTCIPLGYR